MYAKALLFAACIALLTSCSGTDHEREWLENRKKWASSGVRSYELEMHRACFCSDDFKRTMRLVAKNGRTIVTYVDDGTRVAAPARDALFVGTIGKMFGQIIYVIGENPDRLLIEYNEEYGYPEFIGVDPRTDWVDDEVNFWVKNFKVTSE